MAMQELPGGVHYAGKAMPYGIGSDAEGTVTVGGIEIIPTSLTATPDGELKEIKGPTGRPISIVCPQQFITISGSGYVAAQDGNVNVSDIQKGASVTITGAALSSLNLSSAQSSHMRLESISVKYANEDVASVDFTIKEYPDIPADGSAG